MKDDLALFGGDPIKKDEYQIHTTMIDSKEEEAVLKVLRSQHLSGFSARPGNRFLGGENVQLFEQSLAKAFSSKYSVTFNSATSGLHAAVYAAGVVAGDEVITSPFTMSATASAIAMCNATPVFCDIEEETYGIDPKKVEVLISENTKALLAVNIFGHGASLNQLRKIADKHNLVLIEDSAQAPLVEYKSKLCGRHGDIGIFSLNYHKGIQTGEGGFAISDNKDFIDRMRFLRNHGEVVIGPAGRLDMIDIIGYNYRMTEIEAAIGNIQLTRLRQLNEIRQSLANNLSSLLTEFDFLSEATVKDKCQHGFYLYPIKYSKDKIALSRETFTKAMQAEGLSINYGYVLPIHLQPIYQFHMERMYQDYLGYKIEALDADGKPDCFFSPSVDYRLGTCPIAEKMHFEEILTTDICKYPNQEKDINDFYLGVKKILRHLDKLQSIED